MTLYDISIIYRAPPELELKKVLDDIYLNKFKFEPIFSCGELIWNNSQYRDQPKLTLIGITQSSPKIGSTPIWPELG